jgi:hypothetical protein
LARTAERGVDVKDWLAILAGSKDTHSHHLMGTVQWQEHGVWRTLLGASRANDHLAPSDATYENSVAHGNPIISGETFDTFWNHITVF